MRYIGNKTKLLSFIGGFLRDMGIKRGKALDAFSGTASVGAYLKEMGFEVSTTDIMAYSYVFQRAYVVADEYPHFSSLFEQDQDIRAVRKTENFQALLGIRFDGQTDLFSAIPAAAHPLEEVLVYLDSYLPPRPSFITKHFSATRKPTPKQRMFFTYDNGARIDAIRHKIEDWRRQEIVTEDEFYILLAALIEAADRVANTTGVYAAFVKNWQPNALKDLTLELPLLVTGTGTRGCAYRGDVNAIIRDLDYFDLVYLDPPYNTRQYSSYYHVPELIAQGWFADIKPHLRGKTGLIADEGKKSRWSTKAACVEALEDLVQNAKCTHLLMSYSNEGIIPEADIERIFTRHGRPDTYRVVGKDYKRYRSDADSAGRKYTGDGVTEYLYYVRKSLP
jgi:adenine-specific DNA-methyltransferase